MHALVLSVLVFSFCLPLTDCPASNACASRCLCFADPHSLFSYFCLAPFQLNALQNETHKLSFQTYKGKNYHCVLEETSELAEQLAGRRKYQEMANKMARRSALEVKYNKATRRSVVDNMEV